MEFNKRSMSAPRQHISGYVMQPTQPAQAYPISYDDVNTGNRGGGYALPQQSRISRFAPRPFLVPSTAKLNNLHQLRKSKFSSAIPIQNRSSLMPSTRHKFNSHVAMAPMSTHSTIENPLSDNTNVGRQLGMSNIKAPSQNNGINAVSGDRHVATIQIPPSKFSLSRKTIIPPTYDVNAAMEAFSKVRNKTVFSSPYATSHGSQQLSNHMLLSSPRYRKLNSINTTSNELTATPTATTLLYTNSDNQKQSKQLSQSAQVISSVSSQNSNPRIITTHNKINSKHQERNFMPTASLQNNRNMTVGAHNTPSPLNKSAKEWKSVKQGSKRGYTPNQHKEDEKNLAQQTFNDLSQKYSQPPLNQHKDDEQKLGEQIFKNLSQKCSKPPLPSNTLVHHNGMTASASNYPSKPTTRIPSLRDALVQSNELKATPTTTTLSHTLSDNQKQSKQQSQSAHMISSVSIQNDNLSTISTHNKMHSKNQERSQQVLTTSLQNNGHATVAAHNTTSPLKKSANEGKSTKEGHFTAPSNEHKKDEGLTRKRFNMSISTQNQGNVNIPSYIKSTSTHKKSADNSTTFPNITQKYSRPSLRSNTPVRHNEMAVSAFNYPSTPTVQFPSLKTAFVQGKKTSLRAAFVQAKENIKIANGVKVTDAAQENAPIHQYPNVTNGIIASTSNNSFTRTNQDPSPKAVFVKEEVKTADAVEVSNSVQENDFPINQYVAIYQYPVINNGVASSASNSPSTPTTNVLSSSAAFVQEEENDTISGGVEVLLLA